MGFGGGGVDCLLLGGKGGGGGKGLSCDCCSARLGRADDFEEARKVEANAALVASARPARYVMALRTFDRPHRASKACKAR